MFLETAHPVKFPEAVTNATGKSIKLPEQLKQLMQKEKVTTIFKPEYNALKDFLLKG